MTGAKKVSNPLLSVPRAYGCNALVTTGRVALTFEETSHIAPFASYKNEK